MKWILIDWNENENTHYGLMTNGVELGKLRVNKDGFFFRMKWLIGCNDQQKNYRPVHAKELLGAFRLAEQMLRDELSLILALPQAV